MWEAPQGAESENPGLFCGCSAPEGASHIPEGLCHIPGAPPHRFEQRGQVSAFVASLQEPMHNPE